MSPSDPVNEGISYGGFTSIHVAASGDPISNHRADVRADDGSGPGHEVVVEATAGMTSTTGGFRLVGVLRVRLDGKPFHTRSWFETIPRDLA